MPRFIAIAAMGEEREIGGGGQMLWHSSEDLKHFKQLTEGHTVLMGRKTFESLPGGALPDRKNIVVTRQRLLTTQREGAIFWDADRLDLLRETLEKGKSEIVWIIGGEQLFRSTLGWWDEVVLTKFPGIYPFADTFFPEFEHCFNLEESNQRGLLEFCYYKRLAN